MSTAASKASGGPSTLRPDPRAPGLLLGEDVQIGSGVQFGANVVIHSGTTVGDGCVIDDHAVLAKRPRLASGSSARGDAGRLELGARVTVCAGAVVCAAANVGDEVILGDQSFVREITSSPTDAAIATAVIAMAHSLDLKVIGEGVEKEDQFQFLQSQRCDYIQGYLFSPPMAVEKIEEYMVARKAMTG